MNVTTNGSAARRNFVAFICGMRGSGKSVLSRRYLEAFPRILSFDTTGEGKENYPNAVETFGVDETLTALRDVQTKTKWHVVANLDLPHEAVRIAGALVPPVRTRADESGYSRAVGGVCLHVDEVDLLAPNHLGIEQSVKNLWQRGRHHALSIIAACQRPHLVNRVVTSQSDVVIAFAQHEPRDRRYLGDVMSDPIADWVARLNRFAHVRYFPSGGYAETVNPSGVVTKKLRADGHDMNQGDLNV